MRDVLCVIGSAVVLLCVFAIFAVIFIMPFIQEWPYRAVFTLGHFQDVLRDNTLTAVYKNSLFVAFLTAIFGTILAYGCALVSARSSLRGSVKQVIESTALITNTIPGMVIGIASVSYTHLDVYKRQEQIIRTEYSDVMKKSYIDYAMSVIISRALPDVRDGLKPVQRRTLYDMYELGIRYDRPYRKCARIVGDTMGKYHPHGDSSIYEALVVMAQDFKKGMVMVDGHGNFGSIEGDGAAAMRYTEARLAKVTQEAFLADLDKDIVNFVPNFDETEKEPEVLPVRFPNLLVNGAEGIAVGMATSIPTHNLGEVIDGVKAYMKRCV